MEATNIFLIVLGFVFLIGGVLVWKKQRLILMAGYKEGEVKNKQLYAKFNGILLICLAIITWVFSYLVTKVDIMYYIVIMVILSSIQVIGTRKIIGLKDGN